MIDEGPFLSVLEKTEGVIRKQITNYVIRNGQLIIETATRQFIDNDDYNDVTETVPICKVGE